MTTVSLLPSTRKCEIFLSPYRNANITKPPASNVQYCHVITATIKDKFSSAELGSATAYYINTQRLDEDGEEYSGGYEEITSISPIVNGLVELDVWMSPARVEWLDEEPDYGHKGLILHEMQIEPAFRRQGLGRSKLFDLHRPSLSRTNSCQSSSTPSCKKRTPSPRPTTKPQTQSRAMSGAAIGSTSVPRSFRRQVRIFLRGKAGIAGMRCAKP